MTIAEKILNLTYTKYFRVYLFLRRAEIYVYEKRIKLRWKIRGIRKMRNPLRRRRGIFDFDKKWWQL